MPHTLVVHPPEPWWRDRGVLAAALLLLFVWAFNLSQSSGQITGLAVSAPLLAAVLSDRVSRVLCVGAATFVLVVGTAWVNGTVWDGAQWIRLGAVVVATAIAAFGAAIRLRERRRTVDLTEVSRAVQHAIMSLRPIATRRATVSLRYRAADVDALIGGDALEAVDTPWGLRLLVADARGKGLGSLRASTLTLGAFREWAHVEPDLGDLLMRLQESLDRELAADDFVTAVIGQLDDLDFSFVSAGHPMPVLIRQQATTELADGAVPTTPLAMRVPHRRPEVGSIRLMAGDVVVMVTDGVLEARDSAGRMFPFDLEAGRCFAGADVEDGVDRLFAAAARHARGALTDDIAVAAIRIDDGHRVSARPERPPEVAAVDAQRFSEPAASSPFSG